MIRAEFVGIQTIVRKETHRIFRIWTQTILPSVMTQLLYFIIFGGLIGSQIGNVGGSSYVAFLVPGLVMMSAITNAFSNAASSFFVAKFQRSIEEILVSPMKPWAILTGYVSGGVMRGMVVGLAVFLVSAFFTPIHITHPFFFFYFLLITCVIFSAFGFFNGMFAKKFDDIGLIPTFVLTPLTYLGGVFYSITLLPPFWRTVSYANPIVYMIDGFRYGFSGVSSASVFLNALILLLVAVVAIAIDLRLVKKGYGLKS
ncbi:ABC transporter permease [Candidatus Uhrbacteria bacterium RIFOXYB2_FULL_45_11]|uniref:Transport permease protein n=1 Tax=Candidatus Uhrbacteria bacterium RIFOXYB2_FULL_45_11 TaxID=1802421 RepID=A0A1F7W2A3_9BACT|nr:MAG: ABC transporter permease [Candidatus Uhrbacteria bacterium RIFOXYB2_FULL_45_11]